MSIAPEQGINGIMIERSDRFFFENKKKGLKKNSSPFWEEIIKGITFD